MNLYMNSTEFVSGGITDANPKLLIKLADDNGINITGNSIGHDITKEDYRSGLWWRSSIKLLYTATPNNYQSGEVNYPSQSSKPGYTRLMPKPGYSQQLCGRKNRI